MASSAAAACSGHDKSEAWSRTRRTPSVYGGPREAPRRQGDAPVQSEDRHEYQQDAQGAVCACLFHGSQHQGGREVKEENLPVGQAADGTDTPRPARYTQRVNSLRAWLV